MPSCYTCNNKKYDLAVDKWGLILVLEDPDPVEDVSW